MALGVCAWRVLRVALGSLLLTAAVLKGYQLATGPVAEAGLLTSRWFLVLVVEFESILGVWLLASKRFPRLTWMVTIGCFGIFTGVSLHEAACGQPNCGCFGKLLVPPQATFVLDLGIVAALYYGAPPTRQKIAWPLWDLRCAWFRFCLGTGLVFVLLLGVVLLAFGSISSAGHYLRGDELAIVPELIDCGGMASGDSHRFRVCINNLTSRSIMVVGATCGCSCRISGSFPTSVPPGESRELVFDVKLALPEGPFSRRLVVYTDARRQSSLVARLAGRVFGARSKEAVSVAQQKKLGASTETGSRLVRPMACNGCSACSFRNDARPFLVRFPSFVSTLLRSLA